MARQSDSEQPVETPGQPASGTGAGAGGDTHWPTWEDIARLHRIPSADGTIPEPAPEPEPEPDEAPSDANAPGK